ncbi:P-loop containing nucleoside triphosphate hydrolase protein [Tribonema minus]|uniref:P-loop containing nucleoside triphosphate hydrolase protein n=1 Tax=Tribonema minus TaxID=303371 RepID=A0A835YTQ9_9STRA|nr:P-loop containing nucleoside triphosphate hydrolase protein [Tribonema minus]
MALKLLASKWQKGKPFTYIGNGLLAVNPNRPLANRGHAMRKQYAEHNRVDLEPHAYGMGSLLYWGMMEHRLSHSVVMLGDSGAAKTATSALVLEQLATLAQPPPDDAQATPPVSPGGGGSNSGGGSGSGGLLRHVQGAWALLGAFGSAQTRLSKHSTRFMGATTLTFCSGGGGSSGGSSGDSSGSGDGGGGSEVGALSGAQIACSLLERGRVTGHAAGEETYGIFHQIMAAPEPLKQTLLLGSKNAGHFVLTKSASASASNSPSRRSPGDRVGSPKMAKAASPGMRSPAGARSPGSAHGFEHEDALPLTDDDRGAAFARTHERLLSLGLSRTATTDVLKLVSAILHLTEVEFRDPVTSDSVTRSFGLDVIGRDHLEAAAALLGCEFDDVSNALMYRTVCAVKPAVGMPIGSPRRGSGTFTMPATEGEAWEGREALCKRLYVACFDWLQTAINAHMKRNVGATATPTEDDMSITVVDGFGCEALTTNRLEQLCINYANELLQARFLGDTIGTTAAVAVSGGVGAEERFQVILSNANAVYGIECMFAAIEEESAVTLRVRGTGDETAEGAGGSDRNVVIKALAAAQRPQAGRKGVHKVALVAGKESDHHFYVRHCSGSSDHQVKYTARGFVNRNIEPITSASNLNIDELLGNCKNTVIRDMWKVQAAGAAPCSVTSSFRQGMEAVLLQLEQGNVHHIRCLKPNLTGSSRQLDETCMLKQLQGSGLVEAMQMSHKQYPGRMLKSVFFERFAGLPDVISAVLAGMSGGCSIGSDFILFREGVLENLEQQLQWHLGHLEMQNQMQAELEQAKQQQELQVRQRTQAAQVQQAQAWQLELQAQQRALEAQQAAQAWQLQQQAQVLPPHFRVVETRSYAVCTPVSAEELEEEERQAWLTKQPLVYDQRHLLNLATNSSPPPPESPRKPAAAQHPAAAAVTAVTAAAVLDTPRGLSAAGAATAPSTPPMLPMTPRITTARRMIPDLNAMSPQDRMRFMQRPLGKEYGSLQCLFVRSSEPKTTSSTPEHSAQHPPGPPSPSPASPQSDSGKRSSTFFGRTKALSHTLQDTRAAVAAAVPVPTLSLFVNVGSRAQGGRGLVFMMRTQKQLSALSNYWIAGDPLLVDKAPEHYLGKVRAHSMGMPSINIGFGTPASSATTQQYTVYDHVADKANRSSLADVQFASTEDPDEEGPRAIEVCLGPPSQQQHAVLLRHKLPYYDEQLDAYALDFGDWPDVHPSIKNFQLIEVSADSSGDVPAEAMRFGKVGKDEFKLDFTWPLSPLQAFGIAIAALDVAI